jgi:hypothetical protein
VLLYYVIKRPFSDFFSKCISVYYTFNINIEINMLGHFCHFLCILSNKNTIFSTSGFKLYFSLLKIVLFKWREIKQQNWQYCILDLIEVCHGRFWFTVSASYRPCTINTGLSRIQHLKMWWWHFQFRIIRSYVHLL